MANKAAVRDKDIIARSFRMLSSELNNRPLLDNFNWSNYFNVFSSATGDNRFVNPVSQFSPATDPRADRFQQSSDGGQGIMYKELYDNNATTLTLVPGVPEFAGLLSFLSNMFDPVSAIMANKGRRPYLSFYIGQATTAIAFWPMQLASIGLEFLQFLMNSPKNRFYTVKEGMPEYIQMCSGVLNDIMVKLGYIDPVLPNKSATQTDSLHGISPGDSNRNKQALLNRLYGDVVYEDGTIDLFRLLTRGARKHRFQLKALTDADEQWQEGNTLTVKEKSNLVRNLQERATREINGNQNIGKGNPTQPTIEKYYQTVGAYREGEGLYPEGQSSYLNQKYYSDPNTNPASAAGATPAPTLDSVTNKLMTEVGSNDGGGTPTSPAVGGSYSSATATTTNPSEPGTGAPANPNASVADYATPPVTAYKDDTNMESSWAGGVVDMLKTMLQGGLDSISFRVENSTGPTSDTFSNAAGPSPLASKFNSVVSAAHDLNFDMAGGATGIGIIDGIVERLKDGAQGMLAGTVLGNIPLALANNSYIKVPDHWQSSSVNLHRESYEIASYCNYAHPYEQVMKIWVMFSLLLPLVAPISAGGSAYTSPPLVKAFCQSRSFIRTGMVESIRFQFGEGEAGWTRDRKPLNFKATIEIVDLEPLVSVPINRAMTLLDFTNPAAAVKRILTDDTAYNDYLGRLTGLTYLDTVLRYRRLNRMITTAGIDVKSSFRADNVAAILSDNIVGDILKAFSKPIDR